uniref:Cadherin domain-containing protein n=1 Tax=Panagrellus redivivus TaxID=6233 RepID=A0A7E4W5I1_PANRE
MRYAFKETTMSSSVFKIDAYTGKICLQKPLDYEETSRYQLSVHATDSGGKMSSTLVNIMVEDINDNAPVFEPEVYNVTIYGDLPVGTALLSVQAFDADMGQFGEVRYDLIDGNGFFHVDARTGRIYSDKPIYAIVNKTVDLKIIAKDSGGLSSNVPANVRVTILPNEQDCPHFSRGLYEFTISEDILPGIVIGNVDAVSQRAVTYKIVSGNNGRFQLDSKSGKLTVAKEQDADKMDIVLLNIEARATDNCASFSQIRIRIHDINDNAPQFDMNVVETSVVENFPIHEPFFAVQAIDRDKHENGKVTYELIRSVPVCPVIVRPLTGQLLLAASLDYEKGSRYNLTIRAQDQGIPPKSSLTTVILNVLDVNDNAPEFESQLYDLEIAEDAPLMTSLAIIKATDKDSGDNSVVRYKLQDDSIKDFGINYNSGELFVRQSLDRETISEYSFLVIAQDKGNPSLSSNVSVHIRILDVNDNTPDCTSIRSLRVSEDMTPHEIVGRVDARDKDAGLNGSVVYRMQQTNEFFDIKPSGEVILRKRIRSGDIHSPFQFGIIAEDQGAKPRPAVCLVTIDLDKSVSDVHLIEPVERTIHLNSDDAVGAILLIVNATNAVDWSLERSGVSEYFGIDNGSIFLAHSPGERRFSKPQPLTVLISDSQSRRKQATFIVRFHHVSTPDNETIVTKIRETSTIGTKLLTLATNEASSAGEYYSLRKTSPYFEIDEQSGTVYLAKRLDYNDAATIHMEVEKRSTEHYRKKDMTLVFELDDANNHSPVFQVQNYTFNLSESTPVGSLIGHVDASDDDDGINGVVKYRFRNSEDTFSINVETGEIFLQKSLHYHVNPAYYLVVEAEDSASAKGDRRRSQCPVFVNVIDTNDNSPFFRSAENASVLFSNTFNYSRPIHYFVATDDDSGAYGTLQYRIISGNEQNQFVLNSTSGALFIKSKIESSTKLTIRASDISKSPRFTDQYFTVLVDHVSTDWTYFPTESFTLNLNPYSVGGTVVHNFSKKGARGIQYNLLPKNQKTFKIGSQDGILRTTELVNPGIYRFIIYATSSDANATDYASVVVNVRQQSPVGPKIVQESCGNVTVSENQATVDLMRIFTTREVNDTESVVFYHIEGGAENLFTINETSGMISCKALDREHKNEHFLIISASDNSSPKRADVCTVRVMVKDENDNAPQFLSSMLQIAEINDSLRTPSLLMKITATDVDEGANGQVKYRIKSDPSGTLDIDPDTGEIIFARNYPFDKPEFMLSVIAEDCGVSNVQKTERKIRILWNRATKGFLRGEPKFLQEKYTAFVMEGLPKGTPVMTIETSNKIFHDGHIQMSIVEGNYDSAFEIDNNGQLLTSEELDAEIRSSYTLKILGTGKFTTSPETLVEVRVLNANDNAPSVPPLKPIKVAEDLPLGSHIATIAANDVDADSTLEFNLISGNEYFYISRFGGKVYLQAPLDYETHKTMSLDIQVFDGVHTVETNCTVHIIDVNDNAPQFASQMLKINVAKSAVKNDIVGQVVATDLDGGPNGEVRYELLDNENFRIDSKTGQLRLKAPLMPDAVYFVAVKASDRGSRKMSAISTIKLQMVANITEQTAAFKKQDYKFLVAENFPRHLPFGKLDLKDSSILSTNDVAFNILDSEMARMFEISRQGQMSVITDDLKPTEYSMTVELVIRQNGLPSTKSDKRQLATVNIVITDANDNTPKFVTETPRVLRVDEQMRKGTILGRLLANDADLGDNSRIQYSVLSGDELNILRVDPHSGAIMYDHWDDLNLFEGNGNNVFNITFLATDSGSPSRWTVHSAQLELYIENWSGSAPMFAVPVYRKYVSESTTIGSVILKAQGHNKWDKKASHWQYSISDNDEIFNINTATGEVFLNGLLDYERKASYEFTVTCQDTRHRSAIIPVEIYVVGTDEFAPIFSKSSYTFEIPTTAEVGQRIGKVFATDDDSGLDGRVIYSIPDDQGFPYVGIDPDTGIIVLRNALPPNQTIEQFTIIASSGLTQHSRATVYLEMESAATANGPTLFQSSTLKKLTMIVGLVLLLLLLILSFVVCRVYCKSKQPKKPQKQIYSVARGNIAVMADINRASPTFGKIVPSVSYDRAKTFSVMSSNSSDRNSNLLRSSCTENIGVRSQPDSGIDPDAISINSSVTDYLIQIGVTPTKLDTHQLNQLSMMTKSMTHDRFDPELNELIYAKVDDLLAPGARMSTSAFESSPYDGEPILPFGMSHRPRDRHTGPTFQPLTEVFSQISRMKNQQAS